MGSPRSATRRPALSSLCLLAIFGLGCGARPKAQDRPATASQPVPAPKVTFEQRMASVPPQAQGPWVVRQLSTNHYVPGSVQAPWPSFESRCDLHLQFAPPKDRAMPKRKERRPGKAYVRAVDQRSHSALSWSSAPDRPPTFALVRGIQDGATERYFREDKSLWTQKDNEAWSTRPVDDDFHLRWVWEHRSCVAELLALAGPALQLTALPGNPAEQLRFKLSLASGPAPVVARDTTLPRRAWRGYAQVRALSGELTVDATHGDWLAATLDLEVQVSPPKSSPFSGRVRLNAKTTLREADSMQWPDPHPATPLPTPPRYHHQETTLLEGLAPGGPGGLGKVR